MSQNGCNRTDVIFVIVALENNLSQFAHNLMAILQQPIIYFKVDLRLKIQKGLVAKEL